MLAALLARVVEVGLSRETPDDEETDANYRRQAIGFGQAYVADDDRTMVCENANEVRFATYAARGAGPVYWWVLYDRSGRWVLRDRLVRPVQYDAGEFPVFPVGALKVRVPSG